MRRVRDPAIRKTPAAYKPFAWPVDHTLPLPVPTIELRRGVRRSERALALPSLDELSALLWHTARTQEVIPATTGFALERRPAPSAGAIHPIHILVEWPGPACWARYESAAHHLEYLPDHLGLSALRAAAEAFASGSHGALMLFVAEPGLTEAKYHHADSLVWRDAGVLQGVLTSVASTLGLGTCLLGLSGDTVVADLGKKGQLVGVGTALAGSLPR
jgi:hypothetical protein